MTKELTENEKIVVSFLKMLEGQYTSQDVEKFYHSEAEQMEFPNAILKQKAVRNVEAIKESSEKGLKIMSKQEIEIQRIFSCEDTVILEAIWKGTFSVPIGNIPSGGQMVAYFAQFFQFKDGKIYRQRNYDCFESFN